MTSSREPRKPRLLDLFCGAGGSAVGYARAGFEVVGVDLKSQPRYPFEFHQADAMTYPLDGFDAIHASPPCQAYSVAQKLQGNLHPDLIGPTRFRLTESGKPYVIENVVGAPLLKPTLLQGTMFGLRTERKRLFETSFLLPMPPLAYTAPRHAKMGRRVKDGGLISYAHQLIRTDVRLVGEKCLTKFCPALNHCCSGCSGVLSRCTMGQRSYLCSRRSWARWLPA